jgi:ABC-type amino acid transport substrate-binding protein
MKKFLALTAIAASLVSFGAAANLPSPLKVGTSPDNEPYQYIDSTTGKITGFEYDLVNAMADVAKVKIQWVQLPFEGLINALQAKKIDMISADMSIRPERQKAMDHTAKIKHVPSRLAAKTGSVAAATPDALAGKKIGVAKGTTQETFAKEYFAKSEVRTYPKLDDVFADLRAGRIDAVLGDAINVHRGLIKKEKGFAYVGGPLIDAKFFGSGVGLWARKGDAAIINTFNEAFKVVRANGTYEKLEDKYFEGATVYGN